MKMYNVIELFLIILHYKKTNSYHVCKNNTYEMHNTVYESNITNKNHPSLKKQKCDDVRNRQK